MSCCTVEGTDKIFSRQANRYARKFRKNGLDRPQRLIVQRLERFGVEGKSVLEIGCGVGGLLLALLEKGGRSACGVEISEGMIAKARELARESGVSERVSYVQGDFVPSYANVPQADIVVMDKVLCCYPDPKMLIERSTVKAGVLYAVSYPRESWLSKLFFTTSERLGTLLRWSFHPFYHEPRELEALIRRQGMEEVDSRATPMWQVKMFQRKKGVSPASQ